MSDRLRIALVAEGPTDGLVIEAVLRVVLSSRPFILTQLQPEMSEAFGHAGEFGGGWPGVYKWCVDAALQGSGRLSANGMVNKFDLLIIHIDADVASLSYSNGNISPKPCDSPLPCVHPCPPAADTVNALRQVLLSWCGEGSLPSKTVLCIPSKSTEAWVAAALFPEDTMVKRSKPPFECYAAPEARFGVQPVRHRIRKSVPEYRSRQNELSLAWPRLAGPGGLSQAARFDADLRIVTD